MNPAWRFPVALISTVIALSGCSEKPAEKKVTPPATLITITQASAQTLEVTLSTLGALESVIDPKVAAEVPGRVLKIYARSGRAVKKASCWPNWTPPMPAASTGWSRPKERA